MRSTKSTLNSLIIKQVIHRNRVIKKNLIRKYKIDNNKLKNQKILQTILFLCF